MAGSEIGVAYLTVQPKADGFGNSLSKQIDGPFTQAGRRGGGLMSEGVRSGSGSGFLAAGAKFGKIFAGAFAAIGVAQIGSTLIDFLTSSISSASDLNETTSKIGQIFGDQAKQILDFADTAAKGLGQSKQEALDGAATFGIFANSAGLSRGKAVSFATTMSQLASDLASFNNTSPEDAITAIGAALRGESEPIRAYGVLLDDATLKNRAMSLGIIKSTKESLTPQQRVIAAYGEILAQTSTQQGDFARTSDQYANKQRIFNAELENAKVTIGTALLPVVSDLFSMFATEGIPALQDLATWFSENKEGIKTFAIVVVDSTLAIIQAFLGLMEHISRMNDFWITVTTNMVQTWLNVVSAILNGAVQAFGWVPGLGDKLKAARAGFDTFRETVDANFTRLRDAADKTTQMFDHAQDAVQGLRDKVRALDGARATVFVNVQGNVVHANADGSFSVAGSGVKFRAGGGPIVAGQPYIVGENGPELVVPDRSGMVFNRSQLSSMGSSGGGGTTYNINVPATAPIARRYSQEVAAQTVRAWQNAVAVHGIAAAV